MHGNTKGAIPTDIRKDLTADLACLLQTNELIQMERVFYAKGVNETTKNKVWMYAGVHDGEILCVGERGRYHRGGAEWT